MAVEATRLHEFISFVVVSFQSYVLSGLTCSFSMSTSWYMFLATYTYNFHSCIYRDMLK
jgi:hypothetical protein